MSQRLVEDKEGRERLHAYAASPPREAPQDFVNAVVDVDGF